MSARATERALSGSAPAPTNAGRGRTGIELMHYTGYVDEIVAPPLSDDHVVGVYLGRSPADIRVKVDGRLYTGRFHQGEIAVVPLGTPWEGAWKRSADDALEMRLRDAFLREVAQSLDVDLDGIEIVNRLCVDDPQIVRLGLSLKAEVEAEGRLGSRLYTESLANALAISLIRNHSSLGRKAARKAAGDRTGGLSKRALKEAIDYIGDNLANRELTLAEIASAVHMSPYHFSRLFKESTGLAPHQYVIERRVQRAKELLGGSTLPIAEIAYLCGFTHQSHLNRHFKRLLGVNPRVLR